MTLGGPSRRLTVSPLTRKLPKQIEMGARRLGDVWATFWLVHEAGSEKVVVAKTWRAAPGHPRGVEHVTIARGYGDTIEEAVEAILDLYDTEEDQGEEDRPTEGDDDPGTDLDFSLV